MSRLEANKELLNILEYYIEKFPDQRFGQILQNLFFVKPQRPVKEPGEQTWQNEFYIESERLLERVVKRTKDI